MDDAAALTDIEAIKLLKARYCRYLDAKDWVAWRSLLGDDFTSEIAGAGGRQTVGADEFVAYTRRTIGKPSQPTVHHVHAPEITLTSATTAHGVWALKDVVRLIPMVTLHGYGHYHETYEKCDNRWRITSSRLTRLREDVAIPLLPAALATRLRVAAAKLARRTSRAMPSSPTNEEG
ncbi:nuclear transport factor 2 family protein [Mycolicibacterium arseniciresistens]|uniref:Nuclear transport factor 2 family protein n=1 Tax=Mycolicibacterium arseniciresistens TaxID=3062257 RepID=A0ABT8UD54_9MYCO|nr:nuclear transport factor 2 family protein [Mycolicibacterium arseniciresistens]MDO3635708.1 nuclear transport factor 2 family protein [Mycolicibacterium arseniciresistens]